MKNILAIALLFIAVVSIGQNRQEITLDQWKFMFVNNKPENLKEDKLGWKDVTIPHTWNNKDMQSGKDINWGDAWYKKTISWSPNFNKRQMFIRFAGVGQVAKLYVNDKFIGEHCGSYDAFCYNITHFVKEGESIELLLKVNNEARDDIFPVNNFLFGIYGGIYREAKLIVTDPLHISLTDYASSGIYVSQKEVSDKKASLELEVKLHNETKRAKQIQLRISIADASNKIVSQQTSDVRLLPRGMKSFITNLSMKKPTLWQGLDNPYLYSVITEVVADGLVTDKVTQPLGIRSFKFDTEKGFMLNGKPYKLNGVCRHQEWEDYGNALSNEQHKTDIELIKDMGATSIRLAHYQQADYFYSLADKLGLIIWAEIPVVNVYSHKGDHNAKQQMIALIKQNYNHPAICIWGLHNEITPKPNDEEDVQLAVNLTRELHTLCKTLDPGRNTVSVSNIWWLMDNDIHYNADLQGFNQYSGWYGGKPDGLESWIKRTREKYPDNAFCISEYGAEANIEQHTNDLTPPAYKGDFFPENYQTYYHEVTWTAIEKYPSVWASYLWNMFDFTCPMWARGGVPARNMKGLVTYDRKTKKDAFYWYKANWSSDPVLFVTGRLWNKREVGEYDFSVYCNFETPKLYIDDKLVSVTKDSSNKVLYKSVKSRLEKGNHTIKSIAGTGADRVIFTYKLTIE